MLSRVQLCCTVLTGRVCHVRAELELLGPGPEDLLEHREQVRQLTRLNSQVANSKQAEQQTHQQQEIYTLANQ